MAHATHTELGTVVSLWRYPVKSMLGEELPAAQVRDHGLLGDRAYAILDSADGKVATAKNPRKWPHLFAFRSTYIEPLGSAQMPGVRMTLPDGTSMTNEHSEINQALSKALNRQVTLVATARSPVAASAPASEPASWTVQAEEYWPDIDGLDYRDTGTDFTLPTGTFFDCATVHLLTTAYAWQRALGHNTVRDPFCCLVWERAHPDVWDANHLSEVRARTAPDIDRVLRRADETFGHCRHRLFVVDPLTPAAFVARLALDDYRELTSTIQLVLEGPLRAHPRDLDLRPVTTEADWQCLYTLVRHNHTEGEPPHGGAMPVEVTRGMVASYRQKAPAYQFFLAREDGVECAYGAGVLCANGLGMVEDLFTLPAFRKRGIATAIIAWAITHVRQQGADQSLIGAHATAPPKRLYVALGFAPVCVTREYIKHIDHGAGGVGSLHQPG